MNDVYTLKPTAWCPNCISFHADCNPDYEDYGKPCTSYAPMRACGDDPPVADPPFTLSATDMQTLIDSLDETGGLLIKESELRLWIEHFVNKDRATRI